MLAGKCFVNYLSNWYSDVNIHAQLYIGWSNLKILLWRIRKRKKCVIAEIPCLSRTMMQVWQQWLLGEVILEFIIFSLAMLILLYVIISWDVSVTSSKLKKFIKFWVTCFKFWLSLWEASYEIKISAIKTKTSQSTIILLMSWISRLKINMSSQINGSFELVNLFVSMREILYLTIRVDI